MIKIIMIKMAMTKMAMTKMAIKKNMKIVGEVVPPPITPLLTNKVR